MSGADRKVLKGMIFRQLKNEELAEWPPNSFRFLKVIGFATTDHWGRRAVCEVRYYNNLEVTTRWTSGKTTKIATSRLDNPSKFWRMPDTSFWLKEEENNAT